MNKYTSSPLSQNVSVEPSIKHGNNCGRLEAVRFKKAHKLSIFFTTTPQFFGVDSFVILSNDWVMAKSELLFDKTPPTVANKLQNVNNKP